jgi:glycosyltransferase involved in cell wall biosynthesis
MATISGSKKVIVSVTNDLVTDQRVDKACNTLKAMGFAVTLVGRRKTDSSSLALRIYETHRMRLLWEKGPLFYAEYNLRLFFFLLAKKADMLVANDLDTLLPNYLISRLFRNPLIYDSHEYYTETPELVNRPFIRRIWKTLERRIFPRLTDVITVNDSIARLYENEYKVHVKVVRNIPLLDESPVVETRSSLGLPVDKHIILMQGAGINIQRGAEEAVEAMQYLNNCILLIIGGGDVLETLKEKSIALNLAEKVIFIPKQPYNRLREYTGNADIGLSIDKDTNLNYRFSLPNKLFDYIHAGLPVLVSRLPEISRIVVKYGVGNFIENHDPRHIAGKIETMLSDTHLMTTYKSNAILAAQDLNWQMEEKVLINIYRKYA